METQRSLACFSIGPDVFPREFIRALGIIKKSSARINHGLHRIDSARRDAIIAAAEEVISGKLDAHFPLRIWQTASGTHTNTNANEVIAHRAMELLEENLHTRVRIDPVEHVNLSQGACEVIPTAMHIAAAEQMAGTLLPALERLHSTMREKTQRYEEVAAAKRAGGLEASTPMFAREIATWLAQLDSASGTLRSALEPLYELAQGGGAHSSTLELQSIFAERVAEDIAGITDLPFRRAVNSYAALAGHGAIVGASKATRNLAVALTKVATDIRWLTGGSDACAQGAGALRVLNADARQCEAITMVSAQVIGNDTAIATAAGQGDFELNLFHPVLIFNLLNSVRLLGDACGSFESYCRVGLEPDPSRAASLLRSSLLQVAALAPVLGYERAALVAKAAQAKSVSLREAALGLGYLSGEDFDELVPPTSGPAAQ